MNNDEPYSHGLLTPIQTQFIEAFVHVPDQEHFYLTGGTALAEFYLGHRLSFDLDFFTGSDGLVQPFSFALEKALTEAGLEVQVVRRFFTYVEYLVGNGADQVKIDLALDSPFRFFEPITCSPGFMVNDMLDLFVDKLLAYYGRAEPRDAIDLFFIMQKYDILMLQDYAKKKDPGFDLYWFAIAFNRSLDFPDNPDQWPVKMLSSWDPKEIKAKFQFQAQVIMAELL